ncbi:MAG TPA: hypothetical protein ENH82_16115 [bacterium]|nr:hypothetical protein [bacterium]
MPYNFFFTPAALEKAQEHYGSPVDDVLNFPIRVNAVSSLKPVYAHPSDYGRNVRDEFGVLWSTGVTDRGIPVGPCITVPDISKYIFPDPAAPYRFKHLGDWLESNKENFTFITVGDLWERATFMRGLEDILMDIVVDPGFVHDLLQAIADYNINTMDILYEQFRFDGIVLSDDYGAQSSTIMSPSDWRKFVKPPLLRMYTKARKYGWVIFHHSCGHNTPIIPDLLEIGVDILHPIQPETMDIFKLKKEYGKDITFCGGISTQKLLPMGTSEEIRNEVRKVKRIMGKGGGYITGTGIMLHEDVPLDNLVSLIDEAMV